VPLWLCRSISVHHADSLHGGHFLGLPAMMTALIASIISNPLTIAKRARESLPECGRSEEGRLASGSHSAGSRSGSEVCAWFSPAEPVGLGFRSAYQA